MMIGPKVLSTPKGVAYMLRILSCFFRLVMLRILRRPIPERLTGRRRYERRAVDLRVVPRLTYRLLRRSGLTADRLDLL